MAGRFKSRYDRFDLAFDLHRKVSGLASHIEACTEPRFVAQQIAKRDVADIIAEGPSYDGTLLINVACEATTCQLPPRYANTSVKRSVISDAAP